MANVKRTRVLDGLDSMLDRAERLKHAIDLIEELRERFVTVIGHTCPECEREHANEQA